MDIALKHELAELALRIRIGTLEALQARGFGHVGGSLSIADALAVLYGAEMSYDPKDPSMADRDKLVCSKGHAGPAVYAALAVKGFFSYETLRTLNQPGTTLPSHCDRNLTPGVDMTTGSLGQGTSMACGLALGDRLKGRASRTFLITGDGEIDEGQVWEAAMFAAAKKLDNLFWFVDNNKKQLDGYVADVLDTGDIAAKFAAFGFDAVRINGNDIEAVYAAIENAKTVAGKPHAIILDTVKGAGVKEVEETVNNHSMTVPAEKWGEWKAGLEKELAALSEKEGKA